MSDGPFTFDEARDAARKATIAQRGAEDFMRTAARDLALAEEAYRRALAEKILELHAGGTAWSVCADVARGDTTVAELRRKRDIAEGVREAAQQAAWRHAADRRDVERFIRWSMARELAENGGRLEQVAA